MAQGTFDGYIDGSPLPQGRELKSKIFVQAKKLATVAPPAGA